MFEIKEITPEMTYDIRHRILRPHQTMNYCIYDTDKQDGSFHIGAFYMDKLISIVSFCIEDNPDFSIEKQYRLRAMATLPEFRKMGAGREIVNYGENIIKVKGYDILWCKGRTTVQGYYERLGFSPFGEVFDYPPIGPHIVMYKDLR
ncbi:GNAT family N-acetyltransferase [Paratissierella segnis]|jgi:GNAT superfamily N-acetyltransferase|uniref:GNAT family N-acetyltransferase n=1 Tax=Paratissierella segnis TaxID=2763679 RepID=A0A926IIH4_9FIRM|nr:GNAT family N-acetyltransferase [Paratissierella segnis]MBC8586964.1 GNAT family N-acetyltransferase [Paratissierella segnis]